MRIWVWLILIVQAALVALLSAGVAGGWLPLGVPGEWEWLRVQGLPSFDALVVAAAGVAAYAAFLAFGAWALSGKASRRAEALWLAALMAAATAVQVAIPTGAPSGYDLTKWAAVNYLSGSAGYFQIAREQAARNPGRFLKDYPDWIRSQDSLHIGTHPPGLIAVQCVLIEAMNRYPAVAAFLFDHMPTTVDAGFRVFGGNDPHPLSRGEKAALYATSLLTLCFCAGTVIPLYLLARLSHQPPAAWAAAAVWPLVPAANLFQPVADTAYPFLSTSALLLAAWSARAHEGRDRPAWTGFMAAVASGLVMMVGMAFSLAFLAVGLIVAGVVVTNGQVSARMRSVVITAIGCGFLALLFSWWCATGADPFEIATWNLRNHARFYVEYPRTYRLWLLVNPIELLIAVGLPTVVWCAVGFARPRSVPSPAWTTLAVLVMLDLVGRNLGEVARLWMLFMPPLLIVAGIGWARLGARPWALGVTAVLVGAQTLALEAMIQVVYPV
jgi:methylthioxylose transferase